MRECVFPANDVSRGPPRAHKGLAAFSYDNFSEALDVIFVVARIELQFVHFLQVECDTAFASVDFKMVVVAPSGGKARGFKCAEGAVLEPG